MASCRGPLAALLICGCAASAHADPAAMRQAKRVYDEALALFERGEYRAAIARFKRSNELFPHPNVLYNLGECHRKLGQRRQSHGYYRRYADTLSGEDKRRFAAKLDELRWGAECALLIASHPAGAAVHIDNRDVGRTPADGSPLRLTVAGGRHRLELTLPRHRPHRAKLVAEFGEPRSLSVALERAPPPASRPAGNDHATGTRTGVFLHLLVGPAVGSYGFPDADPDVTTELGLRAGVDWRLGRLALHLDLAVLAAPVQDGLDGDRSWFLDLLAGAGLRVHLTDPLWIGLRLAVGPALLLGAGADSRFFAGAQPVASFESGVFPGLVLRPELTVGWTVHRGLTLLLSPLALDYSPGPRDALEGTHVLRYHGAVGLGWRWR